MSDMFDYKRAPEYQRPEQMTLATAPRLAYRGQYQRRFRNSPQLPDYYYDDRGYIDKMYDTGTDRVMAETFPVGMVNPYWNRYDKMRASDLYKMYAQQQFLNDAYGDLRE